MRSPTNPAADAALRDYWQPGRENLKPLDEPMYERVTIDGDVDWSDIVTEPAPAAPEAAVKIPERITLNQLGEGWLAQHGLEITSITLPDDLRDARCRVRATMEAKE